MGFGGCTSVLYVYKLYIQVIQLPRVGEAWCVVWCVCAGGEVWCVYFFSRGGECPPSVVYIYYLCTNRAPAGFSVAIRQRGNGHVLEANPFITRVRPLSVTLCPLP